MSVKERILDLVGESERRPRAVVFDLADSHDLDVESLDMLGELADELAAQGVELRLASVRAPVLELFRRAGLAERLRIEPTVDAAAEAPTAQ
jgi:MFS superfamily sulfate permease-like transporter